MESERRSLDLLAAWCLRLLWDGVYDSWVQVAQDAGLTVTEEQILFAIWLSEGSTVTEAAFLLQRDKGTVSKALYSLEVSGLVTREVLRDRRYAEFRLTPRGEKLLQDLLTRHVRVQDLAFAQGFLSLDEGERLAFLRTAFKLVRCVYGNEYIVKLQQLKNLPDCMRELLSTLKEETG